MFPLGDKGVDGSYGPQGRSGHTATSNLRRVLVWGGRSTFRNGDFLNDMWLYDWETGNWTSYQANELVCDECTTCTSVLANQEKGHQFIQSDVSDPELRALSTAPEPRHTYIQCDETYEREDPDNPNASYTFQQDSQQTQQLNEDPGGYCAYHMPCYEWTGLRPYASPMLITGVNRQERQLPSGRFEHNSALVLNRETGAMDTVVMFGGFSVDCTDYCEDWWHYSIPHNVWTRIQKPEQPSPARRWKSVASPSEDLVYMFGGYGARLPPQDVEGGEEKRPNEVYDTEAKFNPHSPLIFDDLWVYNATEKEWTRLFPGCKTCGLPRVRTEDDGTADRDANGPRGRYGASLVEHEGALYLFGGYSYGGPSKYKSLYPTGQPQEYPSLNAKYYLNDLWRYNITYNYWEEIFPLEDYPDRPSRRHSHTAIMSYKTLYDKVQPVMLVFGGYTWDDEVGDLWQYNISSNAWAQVQGEGEYPSRRFKHTMVPVGNDDPSTEGRALVFGGHGCLSGQSYRQASKSKPPDIGANPEFGGRYVQSPNAYGEKYCIEELGDLWQYYPTACPMDCSRHGICEYNFCVCDEGFTGDDCSKVTCPRDECVYDYIAHKQICYQCSERGTCNGFTGQCECDFPASGLSCEFTECLNKCNGKGTCDRRNQNSLGFGTCLCDLKDGIPAYVGLDCSTPICPKQNITISDEVCNGRGTCVDGECVCYPGFSDSYLHRIVTDEDDETDVGVRVPVDVDGIDLPINFVKCPREEFDALLPEGYSERQYLGVYAGCYDMDQFVYIGDCGGVQFQFAKAAETRVGGALLAGLFAVALCFVT